MDPFPLTKSQVTVDGRHFGDLYIKPTSDRTPSWLSLFEGTLSVIPPDLHNASSAAVLLLSAGGRSFALTFGYGKSLLRPGTWEEDFGLRATLNAVDPLKIRSVDRIKFDAISQHSQIQASRDANIVEFGLDVEQDLLRAVTGKPSDPNLASQLTGKDALKADVHINLPGVPDLLARFWELSKQDTYKEHFGWVDQVTELRDPTQVEKLDEALIEKILNRDFDRLWLGIPDRVEWEGIAGFKYRDNSQAELRNDIYFTAFLEDAGQQFVPTIEILKKRRRVYLISHESDMAVANWPVYRCIYCELDFSGETFLLNNGKWYRVRSDFLGSVNQSFSEVMNNTLQLPDYSQDDEASYLQSVSEAEPARFALMDQKFIRYPTGRDQVEFCDLYSTNKLIIHVKRYRGSATLSHLFSQGVVSAELFCSIPEFRQAVNEFLPEALRLGNTDRRPAVEEFEVVFAVISSSRNPLKLPFFSRVNLRNTAQRLRAFGYKVSVTKIQARQDVNHLA